MRLLYCVTLIAMLVSVGGCDNDDDLVGIGGNAAIQSVEIEFLMDDAVRDGRFASVRYDVPPITVTVVDEGAVLAFFREAQTWTAMPYTYGVDSEELQAVDYNVTLGYAFEYDDEGGFVDLFYEVSTDEVDPSTLPDQLVKLVIIESLPPAKAGVDLTDYDAVMAYLGGDS